MYAHTLIPVVSLLTVGLILAYPLGQLMARVFEGDFPKVVTPFRPLEALLYRVSRIDPSSAMTWRGYAAALLLFNLAGMMSVYALLRAQALLPFNPLLLKGVSPGIAFNTAVSFATNTNWQAYSGESTLSQLSQMAALTVQNFLSAASGMAVAVALSRGFSRRCSPTVGNFWVDLVRGTIYILLPLSLVVATVLVSQGVVQTLEGKVTVSLLEPQHQEDGSLLSEQVIPLGPVASQVAIKQLGTNGGGYYNANSAHPLENPTPMSNFIELLSILLVPMAICFAFGRQVSSPRHGWTLLAAMAAILIPALVVCMIAEMSGNPLLSGLGLDAQAGNLEGKELRFGAAASALWAVVTAATSSGSVNSLHDCFMPLGGMVPMWLIQLGEVAFGGVGSGVYGMVIFAILAIFIAGLMVGRTPELLGKKLEAFEMKMACLVILVPSAAVLLGTAVASMAPAAFSAAPNPGPHGFSELLYAFSSAANNNGSAFGGIDATGKFYTVGLGVCMMMGRYWVMVPVLAIAGSLASKQAVPYSAGTLRTDTLLFVGLLVCTVLMVGALTFVPALALGPIVEHLQLFQAGGIR